MTPLHKYMDQVGMTVSDLAAATGVSWMYIYKLRSGERANPSWRVACLLARALKTDPSDLFKMYGKS